MWKVDAGALDQVNFRELYHQFLLVEDIDEKTRTLIRTSEFKMRPDDNAMLIFGYIDRQAGMSFELLAAAQVFKDAKVSLGPGAEKASCKFRWGSFSGKVSRFTDKSRLIPYVEWAKRIVDWYGCSDDVKEIREMPELDELRAPGYPDDIVVHFVKEGYRPEGIWCRAESLDREKHLFMMRMLNEPYAPFGKHMGDVVPVQAIRMDDGSIRTFAILDMEEDKDESEEPDISPDVPLNEDLQEKEGLNMGSNVKELVDQLADTMREMVKKTGLSETFGETDPGQLLVMELMMYAMYLSASDGEVSEAEAKQLAENFGFEMTPAQIGRFIRQQNIYSTDFEKKVPVSMQIFVAIDNAIHEKGLDTDMSKMSSQILYEVFEAIGKTVILADGVEDAQEKEDAAIYLKMLKRYIDENLVDPKDPAKGFKKKGSISSDRMMDILDNM